jgi:uncharacterized membrane protein
VALPFELTADPAWPWSLPRIGLPMLAIAASALAGLTIWTYRGAPGAGGKRVALVVILRLLALLLAVITLVRPAAAFRDDLKTPSVLIIAADSSASMTIRDEVDNKSRWETLQRILTRCQPQLDRLRDEFNVNVAIHRFAEEMADYDPEGKADGKRTDFGRTLRSLYERYAQERNLRGVLILSDGCDNGTVFPAHGEAAKWRGIGGPVSTFSLGRSDTSSTQRDIALTSLTPEPSPVPIKAKLTVRATLDAPRFETAKVMVRLFLDNEEKVAKEFGPLKTTGTEIELTTDAPATPGEVKVTLKSDPLPGEASLANNEISTYLTVTKEGLSVLLVDRLRTELKFIRGALAGDPRIRVFEAVRQTDDAPAGDDTFNFDKQAYDVIVLGDVTAKRLRAADPKALERIEDLVKNKGVGLLMMGGADSFGSSDWEGTPVSAALPVELDQREQPTDSVKMMPTRAGLTEYVMRLSPNPADNESVWAKLPMLDGFNKLGRLKPGAVVLAESRGSRVPLLVRQNYGKGRTMAMAVDTTWLWQRYGLPQNTEGVDLHNRFWKQLIIYLGQQEDQGGAAWIKPDSRRIAAGGKLGFGVGLRGKTGLDLTEATFDVHVIGPDKTPPEPITTARERDSQRGTLWKTEKPGEYRLVVKASGKDIDNTIISGEATARFIVYQDDTEMLRQAMDEDFLKKLALAGGGKAYRGDELPKFLSELAAKGIAQGQHKARYWPDWRQSSLGGFIPLLFLLFVAILGLEWGLRRHWGMV